MVVQLNKQAYRDSRSKIPCCSKHTRQTFLRSPHCLTSHLDHRNRGFAEPHQPVFVFFQVCLPGCTNGWSGGWAHCHEHTVQSSPICPLKRFHHRCRMKQKIKSQV